MREFVKRKETPNKFGKEPKRKELPEQGPKRLGTLQRLARYQKLTSR